MTPEPVSASSFHDVATGRWSVPTRADRPMLVLLVMLFVSLILSVRLDYSAPKFWGILLGMATFYAVLNTCRSEPTLRLAPAVLLAAGVAIAVAGVIYLDEPGSKLLPKEVYGFLPPIDRRIQSSTIVVWGINANQLGGVLTLFVPLAVTLALAGGRLRPAALLSSVVLLGALLLTQSRASLVGVGVALLVGLLWRGDRRVRIGAASAAVLLAVGLTRLPELSFALSGREGVGTLAGRAELWLRAAAMILDMPLTGIGLNSFPAIVLDFYPGVASAEYYDPISVVPHAHNLYLQTALDLGLPGAAAFAAVVALAIRGGLHAARRGVQWPLATGLLLGLLAHGLYSLNDAVALGSKPSPALWVVLGLLVTLGAESSAAEPVRPDIPPPPRRSGRVARLARPAFGLLALPLLIAPLAINTALIELHHPARGTSGGSPAAAAPRAVRMTAWGPFAARVAAAEAVEARARGDYTAELVALERAVELGPWDPSLSVLLREVHILRDPESAAAVLGTREVVEALVRRGRTAPPAVAVELLGRAHGLDPADPRPPFAATEAYLRLDDRDAAARMLGTALRLRDPKDPWRAALATRLVDPSAPLPSTERLTAVMYRDDAVLCEHAARLLRERGDRTGEAFADELKSRFNSAD